MTKPTFIKKLKELFIRFNTSPKLYLKSDFYLLLQLIGGLFENSDESLLDDHGKIDEKYLPEQKATVNEHFPDYAFWLKPGVKKGALVLWCPVKRDNIVDKGFGYIDPALLNSSKFLEYNTWLEIGKAHNDNSYDDELRTDFNFSSVDITTLIKRIKYLYSTGVLSDLDEVPIKIGLFNTIHKEDTEPDNIIGFQSSSITTKEDIDGNLVFYFTVSEIINWATTNFLLFINYSDDRICGEFNFKLSHYKDIRLYTSLSTYFKDRTLYDSDVDEIKWKTKKSFHLIQYYKKEDIWKLTPITLKTIKIKYHTTELYLEGTSIKRNNYRNYPRPLTFDHRVETIPKMSLVKVYANNDGHRWTKMRILHKRHVCIDFPNFSYHKLLSFGNRGEGNWYIIMSLGEIYKVRGRKPCNLLLFRVRKDVHKINYRKARRLFYKSMIPLYRVYSGGHARFYKYIMPKIAY